MKILPVAIALAAGVMPLPGPVVTNFDPPAVKWNSGHRGIDIASFEAGNVRAMADGVVTFVGQVAHKPVVVVSHGGLRSTYEPVIGVVSRGQTVHAGHVIGVLQSGHESCPIATCLHVGLRRGEEYLDPRILLERRGARLVGADWQSMANGSSSSKPGTSPGPGGPLRRPDGVITSPYGRRLHPVLGRWMLHDGVDLGLPCGAVIPSVGDGVVREAGWRVGTGWTVVVDHGDGLTSIYGHASALNVTPGTRVSAGQELGKVGTTGWSTGCHLHLGTSRSGHSVDPLTLM